MNDVAGDVVELHIDEIRDGKLLRRCPRCRDLRDINDFGLEWTDGGAASGAALITTRDHCFMCRGRTEVVRIKVDELRKGRPFRKCPKCALVKDLNQFGLRRMIGAARNGVDVVAAQAWCKSCRGK